ncbi:hypothetical protein A2242_04905 [Candidatus Falkowbacteria bacterium RIFOXYA2_FULL_47_9]|uniref:MPN domain-containing protein n=1 Tax=Candidatus Falkowbacteria bacterium RIFOXYA2_FULL_47_9 TaxID=1797995 RepID=A0A1F5SM30_9BACT|nr:MAG: hypothetical protein A2242_04905 [Candidatus Falkowbacteria bacterium RIFOXYA2_FULL_47_9]OGS24557.1 MAG: hypothetical protein A2314_07040 [Elusimicrobia bacterium RIFOXYB2_FULL_50_12]
MNNLYKKYLIRLRVVRESKSKIGQTNSPEAVVECVKKEMRNLDREYLVVVHLDNKNNVIGIEEVAKGTLNAAPICSREVFKSAVLCNAQSIILFHNHPSGDAQPSNDDVRSTKILKQAGEIMGIELMDHIIVGSDGMYLSLKGKGLI